MRDNGFKILCLVFFLGLSGYYLFPSWQNYSLNKERNSLTGDDLETFDDENLQKLTSAKERSLKLGLDLQGGMLATLEVQLDKLLGELATDKDAAFNEVLAESAEEAAASGADLVDLFQSKFEARDPDARLSRYFRSSSANITRRSTNDEVASFLQSESGNAVDRAIEIIRDRVDRFGVTEPSIQKQGTRRVIVELPGVEDAQRVRNLLKGTAKLEFRLMIDPSQSQGAIGRIVNYYEQQAAPDSVATDSSAVDGEIAVAEEDTTFDISEITEESLAIEESSNLLLRVFEPSAGDVQLGRALARDTAAARALLFADEVRGFLPSDIDLMWTANPIGTDEAGREVFTALGVKKNTELSGETIVEASAEIDQYTASPQVAMEMNSEGATTWARVTGANVNKKIAVVMDNVVYSYPNVEGKISGGRSQITGLESLEEANDIVTVLKSGSLPAPVSIVGESTVGPSLGAKSVKAGTWSVIAGILLVAIFMIFYYQTAGLVADLALALNMVFIFGILAGFNATLTLPGIAGIVLTIGMAVDANVLIFERIREEQASGKTIKAAIQGGYANALSAILDANITTFLVAAILYSFGTGPVKGFAVTLMAGIVSSLFTAIIVTRLVVDYMVQERKMKISIG